MKLCERLFTGHLAKELSPSNLPVLNPLDFSVCSVLEQKVPANSNQSLEFLKNSRIRAWEELDGEYVRVTIYSLKKRLKACVKAIGGHFDHVFI
ncbi:conserved hypothetical protein [Ixodes scapularis]|uniref:Uncharacterized protein n=1 Tax=Ixodes scapularis TaxID=6945 RepID=B7QDI5_IXOSC|nr:conserved hypothetical protein [Ixodes scapularis]|eukprot:XP_002413599.1 conserved hypothetical protein [Ixodes scapularis]